MERPCSYSRYRGLFDEQVETVTRPCLRCRRPFESEGVHHHLYLPCSSRAGEVSIYVV